jgi:hypothetical protein
MTRVLLGLLVAFTMGTAVECYLLLGRVQLLLNYGEQLLRVGQVNVAALPSKSADRTDGSDTKPQTWWQALRNLPDPARAWVAERFTPVMAEVEVVEVVAEVVAEVVEPEPPTTQPMRRQPRPTPGPATVPTAVVIDTDIDRIYEEAMARIRGTS